MAARCDFTESIPCAYTEGPVLRLFGDGYTAVGKEELEKLLSDGSCGSNLGQCAMAADGAV